jgi:hypothetical protein
VPSWESAAHIATHRFVRGWSEHVRIENKYLCWTPTAQFVSYRRRVSVGTYCVRAETRILSRPLYSRATLQNALFPRVSDFFGEMLSRECAIFAVFAGKCRDDGAPHKFQYSRATARCNNGSLVASPWFQGTCRRRYLP